jgi:hypothetical protein
MEDRTEVDVAGARLPCPGDYFFLPPIFLPFVFPFCFFFAETRFCLSSGNRTLLGMHFPDEPEFWQIPLRRAGRGLHGNLRCARYHVLVTPDCQRISGDDL